MIRIFLRMYLLVLMPFTLILLLPYNPISYFGKQLIETQYHRDFGSIYGLVEHQLKDIPEAQWKEKIKSLKPHFPLGLDLIPIDTDHLKEGEADRLLTQGYILYRIKDFALVYRIRNSQHALKIGLRDKQYDYALTEKQTRGIIYLVNNIILNSNHPIDKFNEIKPLFKVPVEIKKATDFDPNSKIIKELAKANMYYKYEREDPAYIYFSTADKAYVVTAGPLTNRRKVSRYYNYAQIALPIILITLGALIWLFTLLRELKIMNTASKQFGQGKLSTRSKLGKFSTLHSQSDAFNEMATQVEKLVDDHRDLTNAVSHELKTPLSRLRFALQMQQEANDNADKNKYTDKIEDNIAELETLINELLSYARLDRNTLLNVEKHHYADWIKQEVAKTLEYQPQLSIQLDIDDSAQQPFEFDKSLMDKVLKNLLSNAIRHTKNKIFISARIENNTAYLLIEDNGKGVEENAREQLFSPFYRTDKSRDRSTGGSGMGLAISKKIIELHGGTIEYKPSKYNNGAGFLVKIKR